jgi:hypothetical protein
LLCRPSDSDFLQVWVATLVVFAFAALDASKIADAVKRPLAFPALRSLNNESGAGGMDNKPVFSGSASDDIEIDDSSAVKYAALPQ